MLCQPRTAQDIGSAGAENVPYYFDEESLDDAEEIVAASMLPRPLILDSHEIGLCLHVVAYWLPPSGYVG